jgi:4-amino-4-deoxy-L-arabinose transferase-like glycosyltransferase
MCKMKPFLYKFLIPALVAAIALPVFFSQLGEGSLAAYDEAVYAQIAKDAYIGGHYWITHYRGEPYVEKPPLCIWMMTLGYHLFGVNELGARAASAFFGWLSVIGVFLIGRKVFGTAAGVAAAVLLCTSDFFLLNARQGMTDTLPTAAAILVVWGYLHLREDNNCRIAAIVAIGVGLAAGVMSKYIIGLLPAFVILIDQVANRWRPTEPAGSRLTVKEWLWIAAIFALLALPWYISFAIIDPERFRWMTFNYNISSRIGAARAPAPAYWINLLRLGNPGHATLPLALPALLYLLQKWKCPRIRTLLAAIATYSLFLLALKYPSRHFLVYAMPWLALACGGLLAANLSRPDLLSRAGLFLLLLAALAQTTLLAHLPLAGPGAWAALISIILTALLTRQRPLPLRPAILCMLIGLSLLLAAPAPPVVNLSPYLKIIATRLNEMNPQPNTVFINGVPPYAMQYYASCDIKPFTNLREARVYEKGASCYLLTSNDSAASFPGWMVGAPQHCGPWSLLLLKRLGNLVEPIDMELVADDGAWILYDNGDLRTRLGRLLMQVGAQCTDMEARGKGAWILTEKGHIKAYNCDPPDQDMIVLEEGEIAIDLELAAGGGFYVLTTRGKVYNLGGAPYFGSENMQPGRQFSSIKALPGGDGYFLVDANGGIELFGKATHNPAWLRLHLNQPLVRDAEIKPGGPLILMDAFGTLHGHQPGLKVMPPFYSQDPFVIDMEYAPYGKLIMLDVFASVHGL